MQAFIGLAARPDAGNLAAQTDLNPLDRAHLVVIGQQMQGFSDPDDLHDERSGVGHSPTTMSGSRTGW